mmetsp:Transcript_72876/g.207616  ORF Transcript_72876/g.207616 Transcript_72876/m.207616 type:complete len:116 (-) Transcript_72876:47-394(-)
MSKVYKKQYAKGGKDELAFPLPSEDRPRQFRTEEPLNFFRWECRRKQGCHRHNPKVATKFDNCRNDPKSRGRLEWGAEPDPPESTFMFEKKEIKKGKGKGLARSKEKKRLFGGWV